MTVADALRHFSDVRDHRRLPRFALAKMVADTVEGSVAERHRAGMTQLRALEAGAPLPTRPPNTSLLDVKIELATQMMRSCDMCPHHCMVDRMAGDTGFCGVAAQSAIHFDGILYGEEIELVPSHEVFLSGCTMRCAFCYSHDSIVRPMAGKITSPDDLAKRINSRHAQGSNNLNLVGGDPMVHVLTVLKALQQTTAPTPVVWNSNMYATPPTMEILDGVVDLFLGDIHFGNENCARDLGRIPEYVPSVTAAFEQASASGASVLIRHLAMPGHVECCARQAMEWAKARLPDNAFNLMYQYIPDYRATNDPVLGRALSTDEVRRCRELASEIGILLYTETDTAGTANVAIGDELDIGDNYEILVRSDGKVTFARFLGEMLPIARTLAGNDDKVASRSRIAGDHAAERQRH